VKQQPANEYSDNTVAAKTKKGKSRKRNNAVLEDNALQTGEGLDQIYSNYQTNFVEN
jgi:hypothetical protein